MTDLKDKVLLISGATRGIGLAIALRAARDGARISLLGKTDQPHPKLPGTLHTAARAVEDAGGQALPLRCDIRHEDQVAGAVTRTVEQFGGIDVCVNNASALSPTPTLQTEMKRYDLMQAVNTRGTFVVSRACLPHLADADNPHILTLSPPLDLDPTWYAPHLAYTLSKVGMSLITLGLAREFSEQGIAVNSLWPLTSIDTAAVRNLLGGDAMARTSRTPEIVADAAHAILVQSARQCSGNFFIDEEVLQAAGITDLQRYAPHSDGGPLTRDFFVPDAVVAATDTPLAGVS